jgi:RES domain-containing protein
MDEEKAPAGSLSAAAPLRGVFLRHQPARHESLGGTRFGGRWSAAGTEAVYLGRPLESVAAEAYRHLVDPLGVSASHVRARRLLRVEIKLECVLDLRDQAALEAAGLEPAALSGPHERCQKLGELAVAAGYEGVIAPSASRLGETLCAYAELAAPGWAEVISTSLWELPADPRHGGAGERRR